MKLSFYNQIITSGKSPWRWLALAVFFTISMFFWLGWHVYYSYFMIENLQQVYINEDYQWHKVVDLSRQISAAARAAAIDPESAQFDEYRKKVAEIDLLLQSGNTSRFGSGNSADSLAQARSVRKKLQIIEELALGEIESGQREVGLKKLFNEDYKKQEQLFLNAMNNFVDQSRHHLINQLHKEKIKELKSLLVAFFIFLISVAFWIMLIGRLQLWSWILSQEIIEHHKADQAAHTSERKYQNLFENANDPIFIIDPVSYRLLDVNRKAIDFLGYDRDELLKLRLNDLVVFRDNENPHSQILKTLCSNENAISECIYRRKEGILFPVEVSGRLINDGEKDVYQCFVRDISERKRFQEERLHAQKIEAIGQVTDGIAHDFRNALTAISGYNGFCATLLPERHPALEPLKRIDQVIHQTNSLIKAMLTFSRKQEMERQPVELCELVQNSADLFRRVLPAAITLEINVASVQNFWVSADITQLQQVLLNLIINARDAMPNGGTLRISLSPAPEEDGAPDNAGLNRWIQLEVSDTGIGMSPEVQALIFEPFFTTKPGEHGTGLGLPMVHRIVSQHGGRLEVRSAVGQGSTFTLLLPTASPDSRAHHAESPPHLSNSDGEMILLAEDHRYVREIMTATLQHAGYRVLPAEDGVALLDGYQAHRGHVRLLIVDLDLPKCSGLDALRQLRTKGVHLPAILVTGTDSPDLSDQLDAETLLLLKPFQMATLTGLVSRLLTKGDLTDDATDLSGSG